MTARIFLLIGSPAVGKTATAHALAERFERGAYIRVDGFREIVVSGYVYPDEAWGPEVALQVRLARESAIATAMRYADAGFTVTIDDFWDPFELPEYRDLLARDDVLGVLVYPSEAEAHRRNLARSINPDYIEWGIRYVYGLLSTTSAPERLRDQGWLILDNTTIDLETAVNAILEYAAEPAARDIREG